MNDTPNSDQAKENDISSQAQKVAKKCRFVEYPVGPGKTCVESVHIFHPQDRVTGHRHTLVMSKRPPPPTQTAKEAFEARRKAALAQAEAATIPGQTKDSIVPVQAAATNTPPPLIAAATTTPPQIATPSTVVPTQTASTTTRNQTAVSITPDQTAVVTTTDQARVINSRDETRSATTTCDQTGSTPSPDQAGATSSLDRAEAPPDPAQAEAAIIWVPVKALRVPGPDDPTVGRDETTPASSGEQNNKAIFSRGRPAELPEQLPLLEMSAEAWASLDQHRKLQDKLRLKWMKENGVSEEEMKTTVREMPDVSYTMESWEARNRGIREYWEQAAFDRATAMNTKLNESIK